jgi:protein-S-isoprenylcysteine O-methyltransferase Ste14
MKKSKDQQFSDSKWEVRFGRWLFKHRENTPVPLIVFAVLLAMPTPVTFVAGIVLIVLGEAMRFWGVSYIGGVSRTRSDRTGKLIQSGPFGRMRNPLYVGNFILSSGVVVMAGIWWFFIIFIVFFVIQYHFIVLYEEENLKNKFGPLYQAYTESVPRWLPLGPGNLDAENPVNPSLTRALKSEKITYGAIICFIGFYILKYIFLPDTTIYNALF